MENDTGNYFRTQAETEAAKQQYNYASANLKLCRIKERLAEIKSQHEPINDLCRNLDSMTKDGMRQRLVDIAFYVVIGRMPE